MAVNLKAWKGVDGEVVYIQDGQPGEVVLGPNYTRIPGLDRVVSNDLSISEDFLPEAPNDGLQYVRQNEAWSQVNIPSGGVTSVNGETGAVVDVAKTDEANLFTEPQTIRSETAQLLLRDNSGIRMSLGYTEGSGLLSNNLSTEIKATGIGDISYSSRTSSPTGHRFYTPNGSGVPTQKMLISNGGDVGVGTNVPTEKLDVNGTARLRNVADVSEASSFAVIDENGVIEKISLSDISELLTPPTISGNVINGNTISVSSYPGGRGASDSHQWYSNGVAISGATSATYTVTSVTEGTNITVTVDGGVQSNAITSFIPSDLSGLVHWVDAADVNTSGAVIINKGSGENLTPVSGSASLITINGTQALNMTSDVYVAPDAFGGTITDLTVIQYWRENVRSANIGANLNGTRLGITAGVSSNRISWHVPYSQSTGSFFFDMGGLGTRRIELNAGAFVAGTDYLASNTYSNSRVEAWLLFQNETNFNTATFGALPSPDGIRLGQNAANHDFGDFIAFDRVLTTDERQRVEGYVAHKFGLASQLDASHPYKIAPA